MTLAERIQARAVELGFDLVGIAPAGMASHASAYADWVAAGMMGEMAYLARDPDRRSDLRRVLPDARTVIVVGLNYYTVNLPDEIKRDPSRGLIARYAWGIDYHEVMTARLQELAAFIREAAGSEVASKVFVDTWPVLERDWALAAGLGFIGKNTCLIQPRAGSWLFLGGVITDVDLTPSPRSSPHRGEAVSCGRCTRCLAACPTNAFPSPYVLDARKCISYLTIELKGSIPIELRPLMGNHIFGCDICQDVCPWPVRFAMPTKERSFFPIDPDRAAPKLIDLAQLSEEDFKRRFAGTPISRTKRRGLLRNVAVALGNWGSNEAREALKILANDPDPLIAEHARWGLARC